MNDKTELDPADVLGVYALAVVALIEDTRDYSSIPSKLRSLGGWIAELDRLYPNGSWEEKADTIIHSELERRGML